MRFWLNARPISANSRATLKPQAMRQAALYRYQLPLNQPLPLAGGWLQQRSGLLLELRDQAGSAYGEASPLPGFSQETLTEAEAAAICALSNWQNGDEHIAAELPASVQMAMAGALAGLKDHHKPVINLHHQPQAALFARLDSQTLNRWQQWPGPRPSHLKIKLPIADIQQHQQLAELLHITPVRLRLDANRQWRLTDAVHWWQQLPTAVREAIDYLEEPLSDSQQLEQLHQQTGLPYAWDESLCQHWQQRSLPHQRPLGLGALVVKPTVIGGEPAVAALAQIAARWQVKLVLSSALEASIGLREVARLAAIYSPEQPAGIDTWQAFSQDLITPLAPKRPALPLNQLQRIWATPAR